MLSRSSLPRTQRPPIDLISQLLHRPHTESAWHHMQYRTNFKKIIPYIYGDNWDSGQAVRCCTAVNTFFSISLRPASIKAPSSFLNPKSTPVSDSIFFVVGLFMLSCTVECLVTFAASFSERRRYFGARRPPVALCVCLSAELRLHALRISLGGEGNALYPALSSFQLFPSAMSMWPYSLW